MIIIHYNNNNIMFIDFTSLVNRVGAYCIILTSYYDNSYNWCEIYFIRCENTFRISFSFWVRGLYLHCVCVIIFSNRAGIVLYYSVCVCVLGSKWSSGDGKKTKEPLAMPPVPLFPFPETRCGNGLPTRWHFLDG